VVHANTHSRIGTLFWPANFVSFKRNSSTSDIVFVVLGGDDDDDDMGIGVGNDDDDDNDTVDDILDLLYLLVV